ncbi:MAG: hypothetical protein HQL73_01210 [Magnetococcales bacterium]|nr:hypothetical protein [Magnetococcales bacterium]
MEKRINRAPDKAAPVKPGAQSASPAVAETVVASPMATPQLSESAGQQRSRDLQALSQARDALALGDIFRADTWLTQVGPAIREQDDYLTTLAALEHRRGAHHRALALYKKLLIRHPDRSAWLLGQALAQDRLGMIADALASYRRTLEKEPLPNDALRYVLGRIDVLSKQTERP